MNSAAIRIGKTRDHGMGIGGAYRWQEKKIIGYPLVQDGAIYTFDINNPFRGPTDDSIDLWLSYKRRLAGRFDWKIQVNVKNAFADKELIPISVQPDGSWAVVQIGPGQEWFITNTFSF